MEIKFYGKVKSIEIVWVRPGLQELGPSSDITQFVKLPAESGSMKRPLLDGMVP